MREGDQLNWQGDVADWEGIKQQILAHPFSSVRIEDDGTVTIYQPSEIPLTREEILILKPQNPELADFTDWEWLTIVSFYGIAGALGKSYLEYLNRAILPNSDSNSTFQEILFGEIGIEAFRKIGPGYITKGLADYMATAELDVERLGFFGKWFRESGVDPRLMRAVIISFLND